MKQSEYKICLASKEDIPGIILVNQENLVIDKEKAKENNLKSRGFIYSSFTSNELENILDHLPDQILTVCKFQDLVVGYAISYDCLKLRPAWLDKAKLTPEAQNILQSQQGLYHRQIARKEGLPGVGGMLLQAVIGHAVKREDQFIMCEIAYKPLKNFPSIALHEKYGFEQVGKVSKDGKEMGIYVKKL